MDNSDRFNCFLIGQGTLLIRCAEILLTRHHEICGIISSDQPVKEWAKQAGIPLYESADHLTPLKQEPFDYLFSIVNNRVLHREALETPRKWAINYHDAPLPAYAGVHATSWALMRGEAVHGITWHIMAEEVDAGSILKQKQVQIACDDTASTLNVKCYEAAIYAFDELVDDLSSQRAVAKQQCLEQRSYFPRHMRPPAGCVISWNDGAHRISAFIRALDFGYYPNPLGAAKLAIGNDFVIIPKINVLDTSHSAPPGTITHLDHSEIRVSTTTYEVALREVMTLEGESLAIPEFASRFGLREGYRFEDIDQARARRITELNSLCCKHENFWVKRLETLQPITIPYAVREASPHNEPPRRVSVHFRIPAAVEAFLRGRCETLNRVGFFVAAYGAYFSRIAGRRNFDMGFADFNLRQQLEGAEEFFESNLPVRFDLNPTQSSLLDISFAVQQEVERVRRHMTFARDVIARYPALRSPSNRLRRPLLPVTVQCAKELHDDKDFSRESLALVIVEDSAAHIWAYDPDVFDEDAILRMMRQFTTFLQGFTAHPDRCIAELPLLDDEELCRMLIEWNDTETGVPHGRCIHSLFESQVARTPDALAVIFQQQQLTYQQLDRRANQLARYLQKFGASRGVLVGLCVERSVEMVIAILGILKAGAAYVPLDPAYPFERICLMLDDAKPPLLLTQKRLMDEFPSYPGKVIFLDADWPDIAKQSQVPCDSQITGDDLAYVIYTSGSTGVPRGVMVEHLGMLNHLCVKIQALKLAAADVVAQTASQCFDISVWQCLSALLVGGRVHIIGEDVAINPRQLFEVTAAESITVLEIVPSLLRAMLEGMDQGSIAKLDLRSLRWLLLTGEALPPELVRQWLEHYPTTPILNAYGPTECSDDVAQYAICDAAALDAVHTPIGRPVLNTRLYLLDQWMQPVPVGVPGELYVGGICVGRGYLDDPIRTAQAFVPDPFANGTTSRLYKTGDLVRSLPDGNLVFLGRVDFQVKIRGFRIELGEVEAVLGRHPAVREVVVVAREDTPGDQRLVAYVVAEQEQAPNTSELRGYMKKKLLNHMVPSAFVFMDALPLSLNGKLDRRALPAPDVARPELEEAFVAPRNDEEEALAKIWAEVLKVKQVGIHDHFFELGGNSLLGLVALNRIQNVWDKAFPLSILVQGATIEQMATMLRQEITVPELSFVAIQPQGSRRPLFAGGSSSRYVDLARFLGPDQPFYRFDIYALQEQRLDRGEEPYTQIEDIAAHFVKEIRATQPVGPYVLGGGCEGGVVAFEIARQLQEQSQEIAQLLIWETSPSGLYRKKPLYPLIRSAHIIKSLLRRKPEEVLATVLTRWKKSNTLGSIDGGARGSRHEQIQDSIFSALRRFVPQPYAGRITLFLAREQRPGYFETRRGWDKLAGAGLEVYTIPGNHTTCFDQYFLDFAEQLKVCMDRDRRSYLSESGAAEPPKASTAANARG